MSKKENISKNNKLDKASVKDIVAHLHFIDQQIYQLHDYSSEDFLNLNKILKDYFARIKQLSDNSSTVIDSISGKCFNDFKQNLNALLSKLNAPMVEIEGILNKRIQSLEKTLKILDFLYVPLNNLKQNLMTLKLVLTSVKLNNNLYSEEAKRIKDFTVTIDALNGKINALYQEINQHLKNLKSEIKNTLFQQYRSKDKIIDEITAINFNLKNSIQLISEKYQDIFSGIPEITEQAQLCFKNVDQIITNLQYHDIIRQKMSHIQEIQKDIINDLNQYDVDGSLLQTKYLNNIPHIAELQVAQLMLTNKEYQNAIEKISGELLDISDKVQTISNISLKISEECAQSRKYHELDLTKKAKQFDEVLFNTTKHSNDFKQNFATILDSEKALITCFVNINGFEAELEKLNTFLGSKKDKSDIFAQLTGKTNTLINDIKQNNNEIQRLASQIDTQFSSLENQSTDFSASYLNEIQEKGENLFNNLIKSIQEYTNQMRDQLKSNVDISNTIFEDIKASIKNIKYYQLFEKNIEAIIEKLNAINQLLTNKKIIEDTNSEVSDLNKLKEKYTMQSERDIHDQIVNKEKELGIKRNEEENDDQGDLELF